MTQLNESTSPIAIVSGLGGRMNSIERAQGRFLRSDDHRMADSGTGGEQGGGAPGGGGSNNTGETQQQSGTGNQGDNNSGQEFDPKTFWDGPVPAAPASGGSGPSAGNESGTGQPPADRNQQSQQQPTDLGTVIENSVKEFKAPEVMTSEAIKGIGDGDYTKFNEGLQGAIQGSMNHTLGMTVKIITAFGQKMIEQMDQRIQGSHSDREDLTALHEAIPASKDPTVMPSVKPIYDRALKLSNGDRTKAANMTKSMLAYMTKGIAGDVGLDVAPFSTDSDVPPGAGAGPNWIEELMTPQRT